MSRAARLGAFIIVTLVLLAAGIFIIGGKEYLFKSTYEVKSQFNNVSGLQQGADVLVGGVHSGTVRAIMLPHNPTEKIVVEMDLDNQTHEILKKNSVASIETEGLLGNQYVAISFGTAGAGDLRSGDTIAGQPPLEMSELLKKTSGILDCSQQAVINVTQATDHLKSITAKVDHGQGTVGALINDKAIYTNLQQTMATLQQTVGHAEGGVADFQDNMEALKHNFFLKGYFKKRGYEDQAELTANEVERLPAHEPLKTFTFPAKDIFDGRDSAKIKNGKHLAESGEFLSGNDFGVAVIVASTGMEGDSQKELQLTEARSAVVREYLVEHYGFDDDKVKTLGQGKQANGGSEKDWGTLQILVYPAGTETPPAKQAASAASSKSELAKPSENSNSEPKR
jgi:phospholipid/cholesterol/gamma-HCH transport system substrate-binding protein